MEPHCPLGFKALSLKYNAESSARHQIFIKQHSVREQNAFKPSDRTLFILNIPPYCNEEALKNAWDDCGSVKAVYFHDRPNSKDPPEEKSSFFPVRTPIKGFKVAYVVFETALGLQKALKRNQNLPLILSSDEKPLICGYDKWCQEYNARIPNLPELKEEIDTYMKEYDRMVEENAKKEKEAGEEDEDGWVTVTKRGRNPGFSRKDTVDKKVRAEEEKKRSKKQLLNFYSFQIRESKMKNVMALRKKFEEDKKKINALKQSRKFKPF